MAAFWIATADANGDRATNSELMLQPGPSLVEYDTEAAGEVVRTDDGVAIQQQPFLDARSRSWVWSGYSMNQAGFQRIWPTVEGLRSRYRKELGLSPYVWIREDVTG